MPLDCIGTSTLFSEDPLADIREEFTRVAAYFQMQERHKSGDIRESQEAMDEDWYLGEAKLRMQWPGLFRYVPPKQLPVAVPMSVIPSPIQAAS